MTDPKTRRPEYWRNFAWVMAAGSALMLVGGVVGLVLGGRTSWLNIGLGVIFAGQAVGYFRTYRRTKRERDTGPT